MIKAITKSHKEPSRAFQAIVVGFAIGVFASIAIAHWQGVTLTCRLVLLLVLGVSLHFSWELARPENDYPNDGNDSTNDNPNQVVSGKPKSTSSSCSTYKHTYSEPFHHLLTSFHYFFSFLCYNVFVTYKPPPSRGFDFVKFRFMHSNYCPK